MKRPAHSGSVLVEVLVASALLGLGLAGASRLMLQTLAQTGLSLHTGVAMQQALDLMECLQSDPAACSLEDTVRVQGQDFARQAQVQPDANWPLSILVVTVQWRVAVAPAGARDAQASDARLQQVQLWGSASRIPAWVGVSSGPSVP